MRLQEVTTFRFHDLVGSSNDLSLGCIHAQPVPPTFFFPCNLSCRSESCHFRLTFLPTGLWRAIIFMARCEDRYRLGIVTKRDSSKPMGVTLRQGKRVVKRVDFIEREVANNQLLGLAFVEWKSFSVPRGCSTF